jgi:hypothetical protein
MIIDLKMDDESFKLAFQEITSEEFLKHKSENEKFVKNYKFVSEDFFNKTGFVTNILLKLQKIIKIIMEDKKAKFESFCRKYESSVFKIQIENELNNFDFWMINYDDDLKWKIEYFTLQKVESNIKQ